MGFCSYLVDENKARDGIDLGWYPADVYHVIVCSRVFYKSRGYLIRPTCCVRWNRTSRSFTYKVSQWMYYSDRTEAIILKMKWGWAQPRFVAEVTVTWLAIYIIARDFAWYQGISLESVEIQSWNGIEGYQIRVVCNDNGTEKQHGWMTATQSYECS